MGLKFYLFLAAVNKMIKEMIPSIRVSNDARELVLNCCTGNLKFLSRSWWNPVMTPGIFLSICLYFFFLDWKPQEKKENDFMITIIKSAKTSKPWQIMYVHMWFTWNHKFTDYCTWLFFIKYIYGCNLSLFSVHEVILEK